MKVKFLVTCLFVFSQVLGKIKLEVLHPQSNRRLQSGLESIFPEFGNLHAGELSPDVAVKRMENLKERIYDIRDKVLQRLYLVRDYCGYHKIKPAYDEALMTRQKQLLMMSKKEQSQTYNEIENTRVERKDADIEKKEDKREGETEAEDVGKKNKDLEARKLRKLIHELVREESEKLMPKPASHPQLHNFGKIGRDEEDFDKMDEPMSLTPKHKEQAHHRASNENDSSPVSNKQSKEPNGKLEEKILKKLGHA